MSGDHIQCRRNGSMCACRSRECRLETGPWDQPPPPPPDEAKSAFPIVPRSDPSEVILRMQADRRRLTQISSTELVPAHIHEIYAQIWRGEDLERKSAEVAREAYSLRGIGRRIWRSFVNCFSRPKGVQ